MLVVSMYGDTTPCAQCVRMKAADREASKKLFKGKFGKGGLFGDEPTPADGASTDNTVQPTASKGMLAAIFAWFFGFLQSLLAMVGLGDGRAKRKGE